MKFGESKLQTNLVNWFRLAYPEYAGVFFSVPTGGKRSVITAAILKREGALAGVSDLLLLVARNGYHGLCIEVKFEKGKQSDSQKLFQKNVEEQGFLYVVVNELDSFK